MSTPRKDSCTGRWVVLEGPPPVRSMPQAACPFCEGNESSTPPEIAAWVPPGRMPNGPGWKIRVVGNRRPTLRIEGPLTRRAGGMYDVTSGTGADEIVIEAREQRAQLTQLSAEGTASCSAHGRPASNPFACRAPNHDPRPGTGRHSIRTCDGAWPFCRAVRRRPGSSSVRDSTRIRCRPSTPPRFSATGSRDSRDETRSHEFDGTGQHEAHPIHSHMR